MLFDPTALATFGGVLALVGGLIGSSIGIGIAGSAGTATLSEDSGQFRNVIILASLPMTQSFYGLIVMTSKIENPSQVSVYDERKRVQFLRSFDLCNGFILKPHRY